MLFSASAVALIRESFASMIFTLRFFCDFASGVLLTITNTVVKTAESEAAIPRLWYRMTSASEICKGSNQMPWMYQKNSPTLSTSTSRKFTIFPVPVVEFFISRDFL
uniref:Uncharacterized protein n=1 Tax=Arundo donax TaxID=35708 RepID=A0A0A9ES88_ARUDO